MCNMGLETRGEQYSVMLNVPGKSERVRAKHCPLELVASKSLAIYPGCTWKIPVLVD